jgi:hypothetical protein
MTSAIDIDALPHILNEQCKEFRKSPDSSHRKEFVIQECDVNVIVVMKRELGKNHVDVNLDPYNEGISDLVLNHLKPIHQTAGVLNRAPHIFDEVIINNSQR